MPGRQRARWFGAAALLLLIQACTTTGPSDPFDDDDTDPGRVSGSTGFWNGIEASFVARQDGFLPDNQFGQPDPGFRYFVVEVEVRNRSSGDPYSNNIFDFQLGLADNTRYSPTLAWKEPGLASTALPVGQSVRGWLTFEVPIGAQVARLFWTPRFDVTLAIPIS